MRGRQFAFALLAGVACGPTAKDIENAQIHYDLAVNAMESTHDAQGALRELQIALQTNPSMPEAHNALGLVLHLMFHKPEEAVAEYQIALKLDPKNSEAANNLGAALTDLGRYGEAAGMFRLALGNDLYRTPFIARGNLGWALYKQGDAAAGIADLKASVQMNADYCQGYRSLGMIADEQGQVDEAIAEFNAYAQHCKDMAEAHYRLARALLRTGKTVDQDRAREEFGRCASGPPGDLAGECDKLLKMMQ